ncbi:MAG TPA: hypothetical protein PK657_07775 [Legionella sp.]|nr:hypothetical protein [Legionella sp.]
MFLRNDLSMSLNWIITTAQRLIKENEPLKAIKMLKGIQNKDRDVILLLALCYEKIHRYNHAIRILMSYSGWQCDIKFLHKLAHCFTFDKNYKSALAIYSHPQISSQIQLSDHANIIICHRYLENWGEAIAHYENLLKSEEHSALRIEVLLCVAHCYEQVGQFPMAIEYYTQWANFPGNFFQGMLFVAHSYRKMNYFELALEKFESLVSSTFHRKAWKGLLLCGKGMFQVALENKRAPDKTLIMRFAKAYEAFEQYEHAVSTYKSIYGWEGDVTIQYYIANCYHKAGCFDKAIESYLSIEHFKNHWTVVLGLAKCYEGMGQNTLALNYYLDAARIDRVQGLLNIAQFYQSLHQYEKAIDIYKKLRGKDMSQCVFVNLAHCYNRLKFYDKAESTLRLIKNQSSPEVILALAECLELQEYYLDSIMVLKRLLDGPLRHKALVRISICYHKAGLENNLSSFLSDITKMFPDDQETIYLYCTYLVKINAPSAADILEANFQNWPYFKKLRLLDAEYKSNPLQAICSLKSLINEFPFYTEAYLDLIKNLIRTGDLVKAREWQTYSVERFAGHHQFIDQMEGLFSRAESSESTMENKNTHTNTPHYIYLRRPCFALFPRFATVLQTSTLRLNALDLAETNTFNTRPGRF